MPNLQKIARKLEERSHLAFEFPQTNNRVFRAYLPFLENPKINERGSSNLKEYNLIGRPGSLFSYGSSNSRDINITFKVSLLNLLHLDSEESISEKFKRSFNLYFADRERAVQQFALTEYPGNTPLAPNQPQSFVEPTVPGAFTVLSPNAEVTNDIFAFNQQAVLEELTTEGDIQIGKGYPHASTHRNFYRELVGQVIGGDPSFDNITNSLIDGINILPGGDAPGVASSRAVETRINDLIDMIYVWVNLIRSSVLNNSENSVQGPPIIRVTHGPMFNNVPCVAEDYSIRIMDESGFDVQTLTPKQLEITISLKELRTGDFTSFKQGQVEGGDTIAGWEAVLRDNNMDPYNGLINPDKEYI